MTNEQQTKPIIEIKNLGTCFDGLWVHKDLNLTIKKGRITTIIGESGCGKTTLVREILMLQKITKGEIYLSGELISNNYELDNKKSKITLTKLGMMFQQGALFSSLSVLENVMFPLLEYSDFSKSMVQELACTKLSLAGLDNDTYHLYPSELSGGMLKRAALARTLVLDPEILFLDEPTAGLDPNNASAFDELITTLQKQLNLTVIIITHDLDTIWNVSDDLVYLGDKRVLFHGSVQEAADQKAIPGLFQYFNGARGKIIKQYYKDKGLKNE